VYLVNIKMSYTLSTPAPQYSAVNGNILYVACSDGVRLFNLNTGVYVRKISTSVVPVGLIVANGILYTTSDSNTLYSYNLSNNDQQTLILNNLGHPQQILYYNNLLYIANFGTNQVRLYNTNGTLNTSFNGISSPVGMFIDPNSNTLYVSSYYTRTIGSYNATNGTVINGSISSFGDTPYGIVYSGNYLYVAMHNSQIIKKCNAITGEQSTFVTTGALPYGLTIYNNYLYCSNYAVNTVVGHALPAIPVSVPVSAEVPCFKEESKILTNNGYIAVQNLKKGDLVKTSKNGFVSIHSIGKRKMRHDASEERLKYQLYTCSTDKYPELFEDLIITGCHSILIDKFTSQKQREKTIQVNGNTYVTDGKYRLPACVDERTSVYDKSGYYNIYHFALENEDYYMNYGVYANGLLVETCSKRYLNELSNMELL
jgi:hypothetical protein